MIELNKIYCENCLDTMARMPDNFIDLTVTSPPYDNLRDYKGYSFDFESVAKELYRVTKKGGIVVWVLGDATINGSETGTSFRQALYFMECGFNLHDTMIYEKNGFSSPSKTRYHQIFEYMFVFTKDDIKTFNPIKDKLNLWDSFGKNTRRQKTGELKENNDRKSTKGQMGMRYNVWKIAVGGCGMSSKDDIAFNHPAIFPEKLAQDHIKSWSNESDLIYDPFMGSGTTAKMAHLLKRNWIGSEISQEYVDLATKRIQPYLDQQTLF